jgi:hypothetical protein
MGVCAGQMARVSVVNRGSAPIAISVGILQVNAVVTQPITLQPGQIRWVDMNPVSRRLTSTAAARVQIRAPVACRDLDRLVFSTLEVYATSNGHSSEADPMVTPIQLP